MTRLAILLEVRRLLGNPARFCLGASAQDAERSVVPPDDPRAVRWCLTGALSRFAKSARQLELLLAFLKGIAFPGKEGSLAGWSDQNRWREVLVLLDRGITAEQERLAERRAVASRRLASVWRSRSRPTQRKANRSRT
jgi:hypothetical protein